MAKFIAAQEAAKLIPDGATVGLAGMGLSGWPEEVACAIRDSFRETGHPRDLNLKQGSAMGDWGYGNQFLGWDRNPREGGPNTAHGSRGVTRLGEAGEGLITRWSAAHIGSAFTLNKQVLLYRWSRPVPAGLWGLLHPALTGDDARGFSHAIVKRLEVLSRL